MCDWRLFGLSFQWILVFFGLGKRVSGVFYEPRSLVNQLDQLYEQFKIFGLDDIFIDQIFKQFFYYICAISLNNLMLRRELCMWKTGMRIRYNISCLEEWARKMKMVCSRTIWMESLQWYTFDSFFSLSLFRIPQSNEITEPLTPLIQVASLLQARKETDQDVIVILDICSTLSTAQVIKVSTWIWVSNYGVYLQNLTFDTLNWFAYFWFESVFSSQILKSYTLDDCEAPIKPAFIEKLTVKLNERPNKVRSVCLQTFFNRKTNRSQRF